MRTYSISPSAAECSTSRAVDSLSTTPLAGATDHPLRHSDLLAYRGVTHASRADLAGYHLPGIQPDS
jgi:hypothetical protein